MCAAGEENEKEKGCVSRDWREEMCSLKQKLEQLPHNTDRRQFKGGNYETDIGNISKRYLNTNTISTRAYSNKKPGNLRGDASSGRSKLGR